MLIIQRIRETYNRIPEKITAYNTGKNNGPMPAKRMGP